MTSNVLLASRDSTHFLRDSDDSDSSTYCEPRSNVFVVVTPVMPNIGVQALLDSSLGFVQQKVNSGDLAPIPAGGWRHLGRNALFMVVYSEAQYQITWEMLYTAIRTLQHWMRGWRRTWATCTFTIWDGPDMVGQGEISQVGGY